MTFYGYFQSYKDYFWQWEDNAEVIAIPGENTIAYREFVAEALSQLKTQGIPPFGSLLLAILATNPNGKMSVDTVHTMVHTSLMSMHDATLQEAISFLNLLTELPQQYKEGKKESFSSRQYLKIATI